MVYFCIFLIILCSVLGYYCFKFAIILIRVQENIEDSLEVIDAQYRRMSIVLEKPVAYQSPEIKGVLNSIKDTQRSLLYIANQLVSHTDGFIDEQGTEEDFEEEN